MSDFNFLRRSETSNKYQYQQHKGSPEKKQFLSIFNDPTKSSLFKMQNPKARFYQSQNSSPLQIRQNYSINRNTNSNNLKKDFSINRSKSKEREIIINYDTNFSTINTNNNNTNNNNNIFLNKNIYKDPNETIYRNPLMANSFNILNTNLFSKGSSAQKKDQIGDLLNFENRENLYSYIGQQYNFSNFGSKYSSFNNTGISLCKEKVSNNELEEYFIRDAYCIKEYAYKEEANLECRDYMEDKSKSIDGFNGDYFSGVFCIFDGHGGREVSQYLQDNFISYMKEKFNNNINSINKYYYSTSSISNYSIEEVERNLIELFKQIDKNFCDKIYEQIGSTACVVYIYKSGGKKILSCANIGDTRCVMVSEDGHPTRLSYDDRARDDKEAARVKAEGGIIFGGRVYGQLMLTRAFGDSGLKKYGVTPIPHVNNVEIGYKDKWCIIASDGVWDVVTEEEIGKLSLGCKNAKEFCDIIVKTSMDKHTMDNVSCFVLKLN